jgi:outer membrane protein assembly factor BamB
MLLTGSAGDWPSWRGPGFTGNSESRLPTQWEANNALWKIPLPGKGSSTPILWRDRIILTSPADGQDAVLAFDHSGKLLWQTTVGPASAPKHRTLGSSANGSPVTDGEAVYVYFRSGNFAALEFDGSLRWSVNLTEEFGRERLFWDTGTSPVVTSKHVVLTRMHDGESWVAGFDPATGEVRWQQPRNYSTPTENNNAYTTPLVYREGGREALLVWGADHLTAHDAEDGSTLWSCGNFNPEGKGFWPAIASPIIVGDVAIVPVGRDDRPGQSRVHGIRLGGRGDVTGSHRLWKREDLGVFVATPAEYQGHVYLLRHRGEVVCLDPATGRTLWTAAFPREQSSYYSSPLIAHGILYAAREDGMVFTARVGEEFELVAENPMGERIIASPVPVGGRLLIRTDAHLFCIGDE